MKVDDLITADSVIARIDDFFDGVFTPLEAWLPKLTEQIRERTTKGPMTGAQLVSLTQPDAHEMLSNTDRPLYGAGFCATEAVVSVGNPLAWWQGPDRALLASSTFGPGNAAIDLERLEWFRVPAATGERHVAGPFVDYLCSNEVTLTASMPVFMDDAFVGVACADVLAADLEAEMLPLISRLGDALLVNTRGRVVVSGWAGYDTGDLVRGVETGEFALDRPVHVVRSQRHPFLLLVGANSAG